MGLVFMEEVKEGKRRRRENLRGARHPLVLCVLRHGTYACSSSASSGDKGLRRVVFEVFFVCVWLAVAAAAGSGRAAGAARAEVQRHAVEQFADFAPIDVSPFVQVLDVPVPQMVDQLVDVFKLLDTAIPEHVIAVPKIPQGSIPHRAVFEPQLAVRSWQRTFRRSSWTRMGPSPGAHWGVLLERWHQSHPVGPARRDLPSVQGGK